MLKRLAMKKTQDWEILLSLRHALHLHPLAKSLNGLVTINEVTDECVGDMNGMPGPSNPGDAPIATKDLPPSWWGKTK